MNHLRKFFENNIKNIDEGSIRDACDLLSDEGFHFEVIDTPWRDVFQIRFWKFYNGDYKISDIMSEYQPILLECMDRIEELYEIVGYHSGLTKNVSSNIGRVIGDDRLWINIDIKA